MTLDQHIGNDIAKHVCALFKRVTDAERVVDDGNKRLTAAERAANELNNMSRQHEQQLRQLQHQRTQQQKQSSPDGETVVSVEGQIIFWSFTMRLPMSRAVLTELVERWLISYNAGLM